jgi:endonuclease G, mitochondrial
MRQRSFWIMGAALVVAAGCATTERETRTSGQPATLSAMSDEPGGCGDLFPSGVPTVEGLELVVLCHSDGSNPLFASAYSTFDKRSIWSAYSLDTDKIAAIAASTLDRDDYGFVRDPELVAQGIEQPTTSDYTNSGYQRGHYAPAQSMEWAEPALRASFYMTNIAPQNGGMNGSLWRCFEESIRHWAADWGEVHVVVGGYPGTDANRIGVVRKITVPSNYFAIVYRSDSNAALAVVVPNEDGFSLDTREYFTTVRKVEEVSGIDFGFADSVEEAQPEAQDWPILVAQVPFYPSNEQLRACVVPSGPVPTPIALVN